jgi:hypothetical protein
LKVFQNDDELGRTIAGLEPPRARAPFRSGLRSALLSTAVSEWSAVTARPRSGVRYGFAFAPRLVLATAVIAATVLSASGAVAASSLPGDAIYPVKLGFEAVELALARDEVATVETLARQTDRRLDELERVATQRPEAAPTASASYQETAQRFRQVLDTLRAVSSEKKNDRALAIADAATRKHVEVLVSIQQRHASPGIEEALERAKELQGRAKDESREGRDGDGTRQEPRDTSTAPSKNRFGAESPGPAQNLSAEDEGDDDEDDDAMDDDEDEDNDREDDEEGDDDD